MKKAATLTLASAVLVLGGLAAADNAFAAKEGMEKCYGVVKAGKNDCKSMSGKHSCAGQASKDGVGDEWVYVPEGLCDKLAGGSTTPKS